MKHPFIALFLGLLVLSFAACSNETKEAAMADGDIEQADLGESALEDSEMTAESPSADATLVRLNLSANDDQTVALDRRFLSVAIDTSQVVGGHWWSADDTGGAVGDNMTDPFDFTREKLYKLARALAPAYLRIGGSEADVVYYDLSDNPTDEPPEPFKFVMTKAHIDAIFDFAEEVGFDVFFTLNAGPGTRDAETRNWTPEMATKLIEYTKEAGHEVAIWELGNEINGFPVFHGFDWVVDGALFSQDVQSARGMLDNLLPGAKLAAPSSAFWPVWGEMSPILPDFLEAGGGEALDIVTWHYYPQQSYRCPLQSRKAEPETMLDGANLAEVEKWAGDIETLIAEHAPDAEVWLGETGNAQCGGEPGVSNAFASGFWWMDQLGRLAKRGQKIVVRQTLSGGDYGLIDDAELIPNPDYWTSVLWKRIMGSPAIPVAIDNDSELLAYASCTPDAFPDWIPGSVSFALINPSDEEKTALFPSGQPSEIRRFLLTADALDSRTMRLNGATLTLDEHGDLPRLEGKAALCDPAFITLPPRSYGFLVVLEHEACGF